MALSTIIHDLCALIRSSHPLVTIGTMGKERVSAIPQSVRIQERMPRFTWSITRVPARANEGPTLNNLPIEGFTTTRPLSVTRREHIDGLRQASYGQVVNVRS